MLGTEYSNKNTQFYYYTKIIICMIDLPGCSGMAYIGSG